MYKLNIPILYSEIRQILLPDFDPQTNVELLQS